MLSYRHAFHAGNHADVLKHLVVHEILQYMNQKEKPWWYIDTHAGAGRYDLTAGFATKNAEYNTGIGKLWEKSDLPLALSRFIDTIRADNPNGELANYPGSPWVASKSLRVEDKLRLFELHPSDAELLEAVFAEARLVGTGKPALVQKANGFAGLKSVLPPPPRRALILIDPPYEDKQDYQTVVKAVEDGLHRFATGTFAIWYPKLQRPGWLAMVEKLKQLPCKSWLNASLEVEVPREDGFGMFGSGMFIVNPPYTLKDTLTDVLPYLAKQLGSDGPGKWVLES
ncbi:23S rRNA (adenine(2030)-N(6))-methyltransferase RlmJ [Leeia sp. TBRC 13508]|uniref:Ribosomal RNA large subunit methyltransferase J n=1 Tax=Leeia speluncae TaxID=2884804 RepID=A0ABS8D4V0_9NEIS|nr:23S rRNA (adenine(2030)-N(6))-methyltransferase RlmJ [Leeia speluncae]MCB6183217.1 23S rRNA (adenine(2030)-N(6))-methyltransferase RlmJ [Leeia speluncae]